MSKTTKIHPKVSGHNTVTIYFLADESEKYMERLEMILQALQELNCRRAYSVYFQLRNSPAVIRVDYPFPDDFTEKEIDFIETAASAEIDYYN